MLVLILRSAHAQTLPQSRKSLRASRRMRTGTVWPSCFETHRSAPRRWARLCSHLRCDAPQHEGAGPRHFLARQAAAQGRRTNLRLWETIADSPCLFSSCYLQGMLQLQRVAPKRGGASDHLLGLVVGLAVAAQ